MFRGPHQTAQGGKRRHASRKAGLGVPLRAVRNLRRFVSRNVLSHSEASYILILIWRAAKEEKQEADEETGHNQRIGKAADQQDRPNDNQDRQPSRP